MARMPWFRRGFDELIALNEVNFVFLLSFRGILDRSNQARRVISQLDFPVIYNNIIRITYLCTLG
jgi:hypothetical protein